MGKPYFFILVVSFFTRSCSSVGVENIIGAPLAQPESCSSLRCTLTLDTYAYEGPEVSFVTRAYSGNLPGTTVRARAGDTLRLRVVNKLSSEDNEPVTSNTIQQLNSTNLHAHGLHISPHDDDVELRVGPGEEHTYTYNIPENHQVKKEKMQHSPMCASVFVDCCGRAGPFGFIPITMDRCPVS